MSARADLTVCYCVDAASAAAAALSIWTLLDTLKPGLNVRIHLFEDASRPPVKHVSGVLLQAPAGVEFTVHRVDLSRFSKLPGLHGNRMAYARLLIPELLDERWVVYLDTDTLVLSDLSKIGSRFDATVPIYAVPVGPLSNALERALFAGEGLDLAASMFNSGVLVINTEAWRRERYTERLITLGERLGEQHIGEDQSLLNVLFHKLYGTLEQGYNYILADHIERGDPLISASTVVHFVGSPKPWDLFGSFLHPHYDVYHASAMRSGLTGVLRASKYTPTSLKRYLKISGTYARSVRQRLRAPVDERT